MIYLFYGTDENKIREQVSAIVGTLKQRREFAQVFHIHVDSFSKEHIEGLQASGGLFFDKHVFVYKGLIGGSKDTREYMLEGLKNYITSPHVHIIVEDILDKEHLKKIQKYPEIKIKEYNSRLVQTPPDISKKMFDTVAAIASLKTLDEKQRTSAKKTGVWLQMDEIRRAGTAPEEFFGILWWKYKTLVQTGKSVRTDMREILNVYHDAHNGEAEMWEGLEAWVLG